MEEIHGDPRSKNLIIPPGQTDFSNSSNASASSFMNSSQEVESVRQQQISRKRYTEDEFTESSAHNANLEAGNEESPLLVSVDRPINASTASSHAASSKNAIGFMAALKIPVSCSLSFLIKKINFCFFFQGVIEFSICLFFAKFVSYTFLYWLPRIIKDTSKFVFVFCKTDF